MLATVGASDANYLAAFFGGLVSFLTPCVLPLVPAYLGLMTGMSVADLRASARARRVLPPTLLFIAGFTVVFVLLGALASGIGVFLLENRIAFARLSGAVIIGFGLFLLAMTFVRAPALAGEARFHPRVAEMGVFAAPVLGAAFAFGWTPCVGPILGPILTLSAGEGTIARGMTLLAVYSLGLGVPFVATSLALGKLTRVMRWFQRHGQAVTFASAAALIVFGVLIFMDRLTRVSGWLLRTFDSIGLDFLTRS